MKYLSGILSFLLILGLAAAPAAAAPAVIWGDTDGNGTVNTRDLILLRSFCSSMDFDTGESSVTVSVGADANADGRINSKDLALLRKYLATLDYATGESSVILGPEEIPADEIVSLDGKKVMFIGNAFIYYGGIVESGGQAGTDQGWFYQLCAANGENCEVYDYTYGGKTLSYIYNTYMKGKFFSGFDYVFVSEAGEDRASTRADIAKIRTCFTGSPQFIYLNHSYTVFKQHTVLSEQISHLEEDGVRVVDWGSLVYDLSQRNIVPPSSSAEYSVTTFLKNNGDDYHPNPLAGYVAAVLAYCAVTHRSCVGILSDANAVGDTLTYGGTVTGYGAFIAKHYTSPDDTDFQKILSSPEELCALELVLDQYLKNKQ